jgi:hypothetical protein
VSGAKTSGLDKELEQERKELQQSLDQTLETTIREAWLANAAVWVGVTAGAFVLNLLVLVLVTGG